MVPWDSKCSIACTFCTFLASAAGSSGFMHQILPFHLHIISYHARDTALASWTHGYDQLLPPISAAHHQKEWDIPKVCAIANSLLNGAPDTVSCARLCATSTKVSGAWLNALPVSSICLRIDDESIQVDVGLRLGVPCASLMIAPIVVLAGAETLNKKWGTDFYGM